MMIVFLLLIVIATLLFGATAVRGALGAVLGFVGAVLGVCIAVMVAAQVPIWVWWTAGTLIGGGVLFLFVIDSRQKMALERDLVDIEERTRSEQQRIRDEHEARMKEMGLGGPKFPAFSSPENPGSNKRRRKAQRRAAECDSASPD